MPSWNDDIPDAEFKICSYHSTQYEMLLDEATVKAINAMPVEGPSVAIEAFRSCASLRGPHVDLEEGGRVRTYKAIETKDVDRRPRQFGGHGTIRPDANPKEVLRFERRDVMDTADVEKRKRVKFARVDRGGAAFATDIAVVTDRA